MIWKASLVLCLASGVLCYRPAISEQKFSYHHHHGDLKHIGDYEPEHHEVYAWAYPSYEFSYHVDDPYTHDKKGQHEVRDGDKVSGDYWLLQPDGRKRTVKYSSNHKDGFRAEVNYSPHEAYHPHHHDIKEHQRKAPEHHDEDNNDHHEKYVPQMTHDKKHHQEDKGREESWGWFKLPSVRKHQSHHGYKDEVQSVGHRHGHSEQWKHGVLVGWHEGKGHDDHNNHHDDKHDHHDHDRHNHEGKRNFKVVVPYGQRLH